MSKMTRKLWILLNFFLLETLIAAKVGDECRLNDDVFSGTCKLVSDCEPAIRSITQTRGHPFSRCGFYGQLEIVCCPEGSTDTGSTDSSKDTTKEPVNYKYSDGLRIADKECQKIVEHSIPPLGLYIIGGEVANPGEFPHMAALGYLVGNEYKFLCGGSLISYTFVLTASHCVDNLEKIVPSIVRMGITDIGTDKFNPDTDTKITEVLKHPSYARSTKYHDIALLRLEQPVEVSMNLNAICLYTSDTDPTIPLTVSGWGTTSATRDLKSTTLLKANVTVVPRSICGQSYKNWLKLPRGITEEQICAGDPKGKSDACQGDSGGPLQGLTSDDGYYRLVGVTAFGRGCGSQQPGVYTRIFAYLDWIESVVWP